MYVHIRPYMLSVITVNTCWFSNMCSALEVVSMPDFVRKTPKASLFSNTALFKNFFRKRGRSVNIVFPLCYRRVNLFITTIMTALINKHGNKVLMFNATNTMFRQWTQF
jgi:hypothetical protein